MKKCTYELSYNGIQQTFDDESKLDFFIKQDSKLLNIAGGQDFRFSKDLAEDNVTIVQQVRERNQKALASLKEVKNREDFDDSYTDGYISVLEFISESYLDPRKKFDENNWEINKKKELEQSFKDLSSEERKAKIDSFIEEEKKSWDEIRKIGKGIHSLVEDVFARGFIDIDTYPEELRTKIKEANSENINIDAVDNKVITYLVRSLYKVKKDLIAGRKVKKMFIEPCIDYSDGNYNVRGKIDILLVYENNDVDIVDIKVARNSYDAWDEEKKDSAAKQLQLYQILLEANGVSSPNFKNHIIPIQLDKQDNTYNHSSVGKIQTIEPDVSFRGRVLSDLHINPEIKPVTSKLMVDTQKTLSSMFGFDVFNSEIQSENFKKAFEKEVTTISGGKYKFYDKLAGKDVISSTLEGIQKELQIYLGRLREQKIEKVKYIKDSIAGMSEKSAVNLKLDRRTEINDWLNVELYKYRTQAGWRVIDNDELTNLGIIMFQNDITQEVDFISITYDDIEATLKLGNNSSLLGNFYQDSVIESDKYRLPATTGNLELIKLMYISNVFKTGYTVGNLKVLDIKNRKDNDDFGIRRKKLEYNYNALAKKIGIEQNSTKATDFYIQLINEFDNIVNGSVADAALVTSGISKELLAGSRISEEVERKKRFDKLMELKAVMEAAVYNRRTTSETPTLIDMLYINITKYLAQEANVFIDYINNPAISSNIIGGNIIKSIKEGSTLNSTALNTADTIPVLAAITSKIFAGNTQVRTKYNTYKTVDRRHVDKFYEDSGKIMAANSVVNMHEVAFKNLFDRSDNGKQKMLLKDYRTDTSLNSSEKTYLKWYLEDLNSYRFPNKSIDDVIAQYGTADKWFEVPLLRANMASRITNGQGLGKAIWSTSGLDLVDPRMAMGMESSSTDYGKNEYLFDGMYNGFKTSEDEDERYNMIKREGFESFDTNLERIKDMYAFSSIRKEVFDPIIREVSTALVAYSSLSKIGNVFQKNKPTIDFLVDYIKSSVLDESLIEDSNKNAFKVVGMMKSVASKMILGGNVLSMTKEGLVGWWTLYNNAIANSSDSNRFGVKEATKAYQMIWVDSVKQLKTITMGEYMNFEYGVANMSLQEQVERENYGKGNMFRLNEKLFWTSRAPDFLHRMTIFYAYMIKHGCLDAHKKVGDHIEYDWKKDKRFSLYAKDRTGNSIPPSMKETWANQRALFESMKQKMVDDGVVYVSNWETGETKALTMEDDFIPRAYTNQEAEKIIQESNTMFGYMDEDNKAMFYRKGIGLLIGQFKTFFSAKKNQYFLGRGVYKDGRWEHLTDLDGNKLYYTYDDAGNRITTTEITDRPVLDWKGSMMEGIFWSLKDLFAFKNLTSEEGRALLAARWKDPVKRRNLKLFLGDIFGSVLFALINLMLFGDLSDSELSYLDKNVSKILTNASSEFNMADVFTAQVEFRFTSFEAISNLIDSLGEVITGDSHLLRALSSNIGALRPFRYAIYDATAE